MMDKEKIKELLLEPFGTLSDEERAEIEAWAEKDEEIRRAFAEARAFSGLLEKAKVMRDPGAETWSGFLPGVRARIEKKRRRIPMWERRPVLIPVIATVLLVFILVTGRFGPNWTQDYSNGELAEAIAGSDILTEGPVLTEEDYATMNQLGMDVASVAAAIDADTVAVETDELVPESEMDAPPLMDELLALSDKDIEELLNQLAATHFM
jgi:anti-sigma factor RsiW